MHLNSGENQQTATACAEATTTESQTPFAFRSVGEATQMTPAAEGTDQKREQPQHVRE